MSLVGISLLTVLGKTRPENELWWTEMLALCQQITAVTVFISREHVFPLSLNEDEGKKHVLVVDDHHKSKMKIESRRHHK